MAYGKISKKQQEILEYIKSEILNRGFPPAVREICEAVNLKSTSSVHSHLETLEKNGYIEIVEKEVIRNPFRSKNIARTQDLKLTKEQQKAMNKIEGAINDREHKQFLIYGVTGSRKNRNISSAYRESIRKEKNCNSISSRDFINPTNG